MKTEPILNPYNVDFADINKSLKLPSAVHFSQPSLAPNFDALRPGQVRTFSFRGHRGKTFAEIAKRVIVGDYAYDFYIPGLRFREWVVENNNHTPSKEIQEILAPLRGNHWYYLFSSAVRFLDNRWYVRCIQWDGTNWRNSASELSDIWALGDQAVLIDLEPHNHAPH